MPLSDRPSDKQNLEKKRYFTYPLSVAQKFIYLFDQVDSLKNSNEEQQTMLAKAYYTLSTQNNISCHRQKMHINSAIAVLKNIKLQNRGKHWRSQIARAYFKRAELLEARQAFTEATNDYKEAITALEQFEDQKNLDNAEHLLIAQSAISIADLAINEEIDDKVLSLNHPLFYVNKALEHLAILPETDEVLPTYAYAHQIAGIILSAAHFEESKEAFNVALRMAFKTETIKISPLLADIYTCLGLLHEQQYETCPIKKASEALIDQAMIYFGLALIFTPVNVNTLDEEILALDSLCDLIYRVLDPYALPLPHALICDLIDALIYAYFCVIDQILPNKILEQELNQKNNLNSYAQHIYWLIFEAYCKKNSRINLNFLSTFIQDDYETKLYAEDILKIIHRKNINNVYYLQKKQDKHK